MSEIKHHLDPQTLMAYSAGTLPEAFSMIVASHISLCDRCRAEAESYEALGGEVLDQMPSNVVAMDQNAFEETLRLINGGPVTAKPSVRRPGVLPGPIQDYVGGDLEAVRWRPIGMGVRQSILETGGEGSARLLYIPAGSAMPDHGHEGRELTMVLQGAFQDESGYFARGDIDIAGSDTQHSPVADIGEDCICLAVTDAPLKLNGFVPKLVQKIVRI